MNESNKTKGNTLLDYFMNNTGRVIHKWVSYFDVYDKHLSSYRDREISFLEIGMQNGGSTHMWQNYLGPKAKIIGVDIDERCRDLEKEGFEVWIGNQEDMSFWDEFKTKHATLDVVLDDGGHTMQQQINTFIALFPILKEGGLYICEDTHSSYFPGHGGGIKKHGTFHEYVKDLMDEMHAWYFQPISGLASNYFAQNLYAIHIYDSLIVMEKKRRAPPLSLHRGIDGFVAHANPAISYLEMRSAFGISAD